MIVYFNATLKLAQDYSVRRLGSARAVERRAYALGATDKGVFGLQAQNRAGDIVRAYGSAIYEETTDGWVAVAAAPRPTAAAPPDIAGTRPIAAIQAADRSSWPSMVNLPPPGVTPQTGRDHRRGADARLREHRAARPAARAYVHAWRPDRTAASTHGSDNR